MVFSSCEHANGRKNPHKNTYTIPWCYLVNFYEWNRFRWSHNLLFFPTFHCLLHLACIHIFTKILMICRKIIQSTAKAAKQNRAKQSIKNINKLNSSVSIQLNEKINISILMLATTNTFINSNVHRIVWWKYFFIFVF